MSLSVWARLKDGPSIELILTSNEVTISKLKRVIRTRFPPLHESRLDDIQLKYPFGARGVHLKSTTRICEITDTSGEFIQIGSSVSDPIEIIHTLPQKRKPTRPGSLTVTPAVSGDLFDMSRKVQVHQKPPKTSISWSNGKSIFEPFLVTSCIPTKKVPQQLFQTTTNYLSMGIGAQKSRRHVDMVSPFLTCLLGEFKGEAIMVSNREFKGESMNVVFQVDHLLKRGKKFICIVESKDDEVDACLARVLFGCEALAVSEDVPFVYGVVTNQKKWVFVKFLDEKIEKDETRMHFSEDGMIAPDSIASIVGKLYGMLL